MKAARDIQADEDLHLSKQKNVDKLMRILDDLPDHNFAQLRYLNAFFAEVANHSDQNKMTPANIGIVMGTNMLWWEHW